MGQNCAPDKSDKSGYGMETKKQWFDFDGWKRWNMSLAGLENGSHGHGHMATIRLGGSDHERAAWNWRHPWWFGDWGDRRQLHIQTIWLVVWNMFYFPIYWESHHPNWLSYFSEGFKPPTSYIWSTTRIYLNPSRWFDPKWLESQQKRTIELRETKVLFMAQKHQWEMSRAISLSCEESSGLPSILFNASLHWK